MNTNGYFNRRQTEILQTLFRGESKIRVENEISLPDYCSDVNRIIRTDVKIKQTEKKITPHSGGLFLQLDSVAIFNVIYAADKRGSEGAPESFTFYSDFTHTFKVPVDSADGFNVSNVGVYVEFAGENSNGKLLGPRKLILRTDVVISAILKANKSFIYYDTTDGSGDMQTKGEKLIKASFVGTDEREFTVNEKISIPMDSPAIGKILDCDAKFFCEKVIPDNGSLRFNGLISLTCLYTADESGQCVGIVQPIEFEQGFDLTEVTDDSFCDIQLFPTLLKVDYDMNETGENRLLLLELHYRADTYIFRNETLLSSVDCFSLKNEVALTSEKASTEEIRQLTALNSHQTSRISLNDDSLKGIESVKGRVEFKDCRLVGDTVEVSGKLRLFMIGVRNDGTLIPLDESVDLEFKFSEGDIGCELIGCTRVELSGGLKSVDCRLKEEHLDIEVDLQCKIGLFARDDRLFIQDIEILAEKDAPIKSPLTFFYPDAHESLWDIAKLFNIPERKLLEKNVFAGETPPVPVVIFK